MKTFAKIAFGALVLAGVTTLAATAPAQAQVSVGIGFGGPSYYGQAYYPAPAYRYTYSCDRYSRYYDPYRCDYYAPAYYGPAYYPRPYYGPNVYIGGSFGNNNYRGNWRNDRRHDGRHR